jgi:hypothetical protein
VQQRPPEEGSVDVAPPPLGRSSDARRRKQSSPAACGWFSVSFRELAAAASESI